MWLVFSELLACRPDEAPLDRTPGTTGDTGDEAHWRPPAVVELPEGEGKGLVAVIKDTLDRHRGSALQVAVVRGGEVVLSDAYGDADPQGGAAAAVDTLFEIGSETKKITAIAVLQAVDRGELSLEDTVDEVLPDLEIAADPGWDDACTVRDLLTHQSGLYDYAPWTHDPADDALAGRVYGELAAGGYPMAPPGLFHGYANPNYAILGLMVEQVTGRAWADVVTEDVFAPLGMTTTYARAADLPEGQWATGFGYRVTDEGDWFDPWGNPSQFELDRIDHAEHVDNAFLRPAGSVWSTAWDQARLLHFLLHGGHPEVLSDASRALISAPAVKKGPTLSDDWSAWYGMGLSLRTEYLLNFSAELAMRRAPIWYHGGNTLDFTALGSVLPEQDLIVVTLGNGYGDDHWPIAEKAQLSLVELPDPEPIPWPPEPEDLAPFAGSWADPRSVGDLTVTTNGSSLSVVAPDLDALGASYFLGPLYEGVALLTIAGTPYDLTWVDGPAGAGQFVANRLFVGERASDARRAPAAGAPPARIGPILASPADDRTLLHRLDGAARPPE